MSTVKPEGQVAATAVQGTEQPGRPQYLLNPTCLGLLEAFSDGPSRAILNSTISGCKSIEELAHGNNIPTSTTYRRVHHLVDQGFLVVERVVTGEGGKRHSLFRSTLQGAQIVVRQGGFQVTLAPNPSAHDVALGT